MYVHNLVQAQDKSKLKAHAAFQVQDVLVMMQEPVVPMCFLRVRAVGVMHMIDQGEQDDKIIAVHVDDPECVPLSVWHPAAGVRLNEPGDCHRCTVAQCTDFCGACWRCRERLPVDGPVWSSHALSMSGPCQVHDSHALPHWRMTLAGLFVSTIFTASLSRSALRHHPDAWW